MRFLSSNFKKSFIFFLFLHSNIIYSVDSSIGKTIILSSPEDPYYILAKEIANEENIPIVNSIDMVFPQNPTFLIWVVSPSHISNREIVNFSYAIRNLKSSISVGIICGTTLEDARKLWLRRRHKPGDKFVKANMETIIREHEIIILDNDKKKTIPLTKENFLESLRTADYFTNNLHGAPKVWAYEKESQITRIHPSDIPDLKPCVILAHSCDNFRFWEQNSIVMKCVEKGAMACAGFPYKPNSGYMIGQFDDFIFQHTWAEFPIGHIVQIMNHGTLQGFANFPYFFLLGDPRIYFQNMAPYCIVEDRTFEDHRKIKFMKPKTGFIPVRIPDGAKYNFVSISGVTSSSYYDQFYNSRLQMMNINNNKYILFKNQCDEFTIHLHLKPKYYWKILDFVTDFLDTGLLLNTIKSDNGPMPSLFFGVIGLIIVLVFYLRKKIEFWTIKYVIISGAILSAIIICYTIIRLHKITVISQTIKLSFPSFIGIFLLVVCGALLFLNSKSILLKSLGIGIAVFPSLLGTIFGFSALFFANISYKQLVEINLYNYKLPLMYMYTLIFEFIICGLVFKLTESIVQKGIIKLKS